MTQPFGSGAPIPVEGVTGGPGLPQGVASIDGTTGNIQISSPSNTTQFKKANVPQVLQVYEYFLSNTDFARISLNTQTNGPFQLAVETQPPAVLRDLAIISKRDIFITGPLLPSTTATYDIGSASRLWANIYSMGTLFAGFGVRPGIGGVGNATTLTAGTGVPSVAAGVNGDFYFRSDGGALTSIYQKRGGAWIGIV